LLWFLPCSVDLAVQAQSDPIPHSKDEPTWDDPTGHARIF